MCIVGESESGHGGRFEPCDAYKRLQEEDTLAGIEARSVAVAIWRRRYSKEAPNWKPLDTTAGVVSQIDNMTAGLMNDFSALEAENAALRQERDRLAGIMEKADALEALLTRVSDCYEHEMSIVTVDKIDGALGKYRKARHAV